MGRFEEGAKKTKQVLFLADEETFKQLESLRVYKGESKGWILRMLIRNAYRRVMESAEDAPPLRMCDLAHI